MTLAAAGLKLRGDEDAPTKLAKLRSMYEPYMHSTAKNLMLTLPPWQHPAKTRDNWQAGPWDRMIQAQGLAVLGQKPVTPATRARTTISKSDASGSSGFRLSLHSEHGVNWTLRAGCVTRFRTLARGLPAAYEKLKSARTLRPWVPARPVPAGKFELGNC